MTSPRHPATRCPNAARGVMVVDRGGEGRDEGEMDASVGVVDRRYWFGYWFSTGVPVAMS